LAYLHNIFTFPLCNITEGENKKKKADLSRRKGPQRGMDQKRTVSSSFAEARFSRRSRSAIIAMNSELVGFPRAPLTE